MKLLFVLPAFILIISFTSFAQDGDGSIEGTLGIGPRFGYYKSNDAEKGANFIGAQVRLRMGAVLGFEGALDYRLGESFNVSTMQALTNSAKVSYVPLTLSALLFIPLHPHFAPYGLAGVGWYYTIINYELDAASLSQLGPQLTDTDKSVFGYHLGLGIELPFNKNIAANIDYRYLFLDSQVKHVKELLQGIPNLDTKNSNGSVITASIMLYF
jgi:opacity protein-like surface antigen